MYNEQMNENTQIIEVFPILHGLNNNAARRQKKSEKCKSYFGRSKSILAEKNALKQRLLSEFSQYSSKSLLEVITLP